ncbi:MAG: hypothetical protein MJE68_13760 [Proteobacteria bacterium]|nr:hypothetical protein [Pseudomonadota bacterium]
MAIFIHPSVRSNPRSVLFRRGGTIGFPPPENCHNYYTTYNEKYFQKVSFCVITHLIGQNGRAVCKKHGNHGDARGAKRRGRPAGHRSQVRVLEYSSMYEYSLGASRPSA